MVETSQLYNGYVTLHGAKSPVYSLVNQCLPKEKEKLENRGRVRRKNVAGEPRIEK